LEWVKPTSGDDEILLATTSGQAIRFSEHDARPMGRAAAGVRGIRLRAKDSVISLEVIDRKRAPTLELFVLSENGLGKRTELKYYKTQHRGGSGIKTMKVTPKTGPIVSTHIIDRDSEQDLVVITEKGQTLRTQMKKISSMGRATQGVRVMKLDAGDKLASSSLV
ncbi:MAG TPA: DNA gyrase C-terminal beta-propeller domain-containing protein, partial [Patescibacteria group bacterium]|nr:DNA gyrase C-terminal beta-propeller domain-containing protein [Patescibacteria group bacterium]